MRHSSSAIGNGKRREIALALLLLASIGGYANDLPSVSSPAAQACVDKNQPPDSLTQQVTLRSFDDSGLIEESVADMYVLRLDDDNSRAVLRLSAPASRKDVAVLMIENGDLKPDMFLYVPDLRRTRKVTGKQLATSMMGTDFSYEEFSYLQDTASTSDTKRIDDQNVGDIPAYVFDTTPQGEDLVYSRIISFVDQDRCTPLKTEFYLVNGELGKELIVSPESIKQVGAHFVPHAMVMHDRKKATRTELNIDNVAIDVELNESIFSPKRLGMKP